MTINRIKPDLCNVSGSGKVTVDPNPAPDQHKNLLISRRSPLANVYHVWSTSVNPFVSYPAHRQTERTTERNDHITPPALAE